MVCNRHRILFANKNEMDGHVAGMEDKRSAYKVLVGKPK